MFPDRVSQGHFPKEGEVVFQGEKGAEVTLREGGDPGNGGSIPTVRPGRIEQFMPMKEAHTSNHPEMGHSEYKIKAVRSPVTGMVDLSGILVIGEGFKHGAGISEWYWDFEDPNLAAIRPNFGESNPIQEVGSASLHYPGFEKIEGICELTTSISGGRDGIRIAIREGFIGGNHPFNGWVNGAKIKWSIRYEGIP